MNQIDDEKSAHKALRISNGNKSSIDDKIDTFDVFYNCKKCLFLVSIVINFLVSDI
jgi:hypothetical protein